ncbi:MAG TPA: glutathione S-transferase N-terminal domain-containing protein [Gaiellaceae bacterium]
MLTLWQAEWCRQSAEVRERLTELGVDVMLRQVAAEPRKRYELLSRFDETSVPILELGNGHHIAGADPIVAWLDEHYEERDDALLHRNRAERAREFAVAAAR